MGTIHSRRRKPGLQSAFAGVVGFMAVVQVLVVLASLTGVTFSRPAAFLVLGAASVLSGFFATRFFDAPGRGKEQRPPRGIGRLVARAAVWSIGFAVVGWSVWVWLQLWNLAWLRPPYDWDGLYYHIPAIHEWVMAGRVSFVGTMPYVPYVNYPMGVELFSFFAYFLLGTSRLVNACNLWYWPLAVLALAVIAQCLGVRGIWRWVAGALVAGVPAFVCQSVSCYVDPGFTAAVMASIAAACLFVFDDTTPGFWRAVLLGAAVGLAAGSKGTGFPFAMVFVAAVTVAAFWIYRFVDWKRWAQRVVVVVVVTVAVGGYWYVRNAAVTKNPIYPMQVKIGAKVLVEGWDHEDFDRENMPAWLESYPGWQRVLVSWTQPDAPVSGYAPVGGMGYLWLAGGIPAFVLLSWQRLRKRSRKGPSELVFVAALAAVLLAVQPSPWWSRFTLWLHALGLPCLVAVTSHAAGRLRQNGWHAATIALAAGVVGVAVWESSVTLALERRDGAAGDAGITGEKYVSSLEYLLPGISDNTALRHFFTAENIARSPWRTATGTLLGGVLAMPLDKRTIKVLPELPDENYVTGLRRSGVEWVVWDEVTGGPVPESIKRHLQERYVYNPAPDVKFNFLRLERLPLSSGQVERVPGEVTIR